MPLAQIYKFFIKHRVIACLMIPLIFTNYSTASPRETTVQKTPAPRISAIGPDQEQLVTGKVRTWDYPSDEISLPEAVSSDVISISEGDQHHLAIKADGSLIAWGANNEGECDIPAELQGKVISFAAGYQFSVALKDDGTVAAWGSNYYGKATVPPGLNNVVAIAAGTSHAAALKRDGTVVAWGRDQNLETGVATEQTGVVAISAGMDTTMILKEDGTVFAWGGSNTIWDGIPEDLVGVEAIATGGSHALALKDDGTVVSWGYPNWYSSELPAIPNNLHKVKQLGSDGLTSYALQADGRLVSWGSMSPLQRSFLADNKGIRTFSARSSTLSVVTDSVISFIHQQTGTTSPAKTITIQNRGDSILELGEVEIFGESADAYSLDLDSLPDEIPAGESGTFSITFSPNHQGVNAARISIHSNDPITPNLQIALFSEVIPEIKILAVHSATGAAEIQSNEEHFIAETEVGETSEPGIFIIRNTGSGDLENLAFSLSGLHSNDFIIEPPSTTRVAPGEEITFGVRFSPSLTGIRKAILSITSNESDENPFQIEISGKHPAPKLAIEDSGQELLLGGVIAWGANNYGQCNVPIGANSGVKQVAGGDYFTIALKHDGTVIGWGNNTFGETSIPEGLSDVKQIAAGWFHALALKTDGTVVAWGSNSDHQTDVPEGLTDVIAISAGLYHSIALKSNGSVVAWGSQSYYQSTVPVLANDGVAIDAGLNHNTLLKSDGTVYSWGKVGTDPRHRPLPPMTTITAGADFSMFLDLEGNVHYFLGQHRFSDEDTIGGFKTISAGEHFVVGVKKDDSLVICGNTLSGLLDIPEDLPPVVGLGCGDSHVAAISQSDIRFEDISTRTFSLKNLGRLPLEIHNVVTSGPNASDFHLRAHPATPSLHSPVKILDS